MENQEKNEVVCGDREIEYTQVLAPVGETNRNHVFYNLEKLQEMGREGWEIVCELNKSFDGIVFLLKKVNSKR